MNHMLYYTCRLAECLIHAMASIFRPPFLPLLPETIWNRACFFAEIDMV